jgi:hypothetical protein
LVVQIPVRCALTFVLLSVATAPALAQTERASAPEPVLRRWVDLQNVNLNIRYRYVDNTEGEVTTDQTQHREGFRARVKFDGAGRYALTIGATTGVRFTSGWNNTGWGAAGAHADFDVRGLYLSAQPRRAVEAQVGAIYVVKGQSTEITSYDDDGFLTGARVIVRAPARLFFHEIVATRAHLTADPAAIPAGKRLSHIDETNYQQYLLGRRFGRRAEVSLDYTDDRGASTWRQGVDVKTPELRVVDSVIIEAYERIDRIEGRGFAITAAKTLNRHLAFDAGYASIDPDYGGLNADRIQSGKRVFGTATYNFSPDFVASVFVTTLIGNNPTLPQRTLRNVSFTYNALPALRRTGLF